MRTIMHNLHHMHMLKTRRTHDVVRVTCRLGDAHPILGKAALIGSCVSVYLPLHETSTRSRKNSRRDVLCVGAQELRGRSTAPRAFLFCLHIE